MTGFLQLSCGHEFFKEKFKVITFIGSRYRNETKVQEVELDW